MEHNPRMANGEAATAQDIVRRPRRHTAGDLAESAVFEAIMAGTIPAGAPLRLHELASKLGMSIMPVREALRRLEALGLVEIIPHRGAWVRPLSLQDLTDTYFTRVNLECLAIRTAAAHFGPKHARKARAALEELAAARSRKDQVDARDAHERFHFAIYEASGSEWLIRSIAPAWRNSERYRVASMRNAKHLRAREKEHHAMLEALEAADGELAARLLAHHLRTSADLVAAALVREGARDDAPRVPEIDDVMPSIAHHIDVDPLR
jgi:DNA-binding GntR family transcriptional regulator